MKNFMKNMNTKKKYHIHINIIYRIINHHQQIKKKEQILTHQILTLEKFKFHR